MSLKDKIKDLCKKNNVNMSTVEESLGFASGYLSKLDKSTPNTKRMQKIADYFGVTVDYLMTGKEPDNIPYFLDDEARAIAQEIATRPDLKILFDTSKKVSAEDLKFVIQLVEKLDKTTEE